MNYEFMIRHRYLIINLITLVLGSISCLFGYGFKFDLLLYSITSTLLLKYVLLPSIEEGSRRFFKGVKDGLHEVATANVAGFNLRTMSIKFGDHFTGITACFYSAMQNPSTSVVVAELVKIGSFLGVEIPIVNVITSKAAAIASNAIRTESLEDCIPLIGTAAALSGQEITGISVDAFIQKQARNITNMKVIQDQLRVVLETSGIVMPRNHEKIVEISTLLADIREDFEYFTKLMAIAGHELNKPEGRKRLQTFETKVKELNTLIKSVNQPSLKNNVIFTEASSLISLALKILVQAKMIQSQRMRPTPVGVCIQGVSGIGKSTLISAITNAVKAEITEKYCESVGNAMDWQTWFAQFRDDFDTGYNGQEITYMDDAFQKKDCSDHPMWINFISNQPIGMVMAKEEEKGKPYNSLMCLVTCNVIPEKSTTISSIAALHNRFPITVLAKLKKGHKLPSASSEYDPSFKHINFEMGRMIDIANAPVGAKTEAVSFKEIIKAIALSIHNNNERCARILNSDVTHFQGSSSDEDEVILFDPAKVTGEEEEPFLDYAQPESNLPIIEEGTSEDPSVFEPAETSQDEFNSDSDFFTREEKYWAEVPANAKSVHMKQVLDAKPWTNWEVDKNIGESVLRAFTNQPVTSIRGLGPWIFRIRRKSDKKMLKDVYHEYHDMPPADFLRAFAIWQIESDERLKLRTVPALRVVDTFGTEYIWCPSLAGGEFLFPATEEFRQEIITAMAPMFTRCKGYVKKHIMYSWNQGHLKKAIIRYAIATTGTIFLPVPLITGFFEAQAIYSAQPLFNAMVEDAENQHWFIKYNPSLRVEYWLRSRVEKSYGVIENKLKIIKDTTVSMILKTCEILGIDTTGMIESFAEMAGDVALHATILSLFSILAYMLYKLVCSFSNEKMPWELTEEGEYNKERFTRKARKTKRVIKKLRVETSHLHCNDCSSNTTVDIMGETFDYHHDKASNDLYNAEFIDIIDEYTDEDTTYVGSIYQCKGQCSLISIYSAEEELHIKENRVKYYGQKPHPLMGGKKVVNIHLQCKGSDIREEVSKILQGYKVLAIDEIMVDFAITYREHETACDLIIFGLRSGKEGRLGLITKKNIASCSKFADNYNMDKIDVNSDTITDIVQTQAMQSAVTLGNSIKENHQVQIATCALEHIDTERYSCRSFGFGHKNVIITNAHVTELGSFVRFHRSTKVTPTLKDYYLAITEYRDPVRDIAILRILKPSEARSVTGRPLFRLTNNEITFGDLSKHLYTAETCNLVLDSTPVMVDFPRSGITVPAVARCRERKVRKFTDNTRECEYVEISGFVIEATFSKPGDCGGYIMATNDRYETKMIGFHAASGNNSWFGTILTKEDLRVIRVETNSSDPWSKLILPGKPTDMPLGTEVGFVGKYKGTTMPVSSESISHWNRSPWFESFEEQLEPSPLAASDKRIQVEIPTNSEGRPSLLIAQNSIMCKELPEMEQHILDIIEKSMIDELSCKLSGDLKTTPADEEQLLANALNGTRDNIYVTNMTINKAAGIPWASIPKGMLKSDYLTLENDRIVFKEGLGAVLKKRVLYKLREASKGVRVISFSNSKIKDALIKKKAVSIGKVRVFHSIPVDKIIADSALFGNFKESFQRLYVDGNHAIGVNPHSKNWGAIHDKITRHLNYFDCDFENYDKHLHKELMQTVFNIIIKTIDKVAPDEWIEARKILATESIETYVVDYDTIYKTERGNKSGEFLTTIVNCIANDILSFYAWIKNTGIDSIEVFRDNVSLVSFGDDKIESVSDEYATQYNYMTVKEVLTSIGHKITPGSKDGIEQPFTSIDNLQFIKRSFKEMNGEIVAPLSQRSIEAPFTWTSLTPMDLKIWEGVIKEKLYEAYLWDKEYYDELRNKLSKCNSKPLRLLIAPMLAVPYEQCDYWKSCFKYE